MPTRKVVAETKVAVFIQLDIEASLAPPSSVMILKTQNKLYKLAVWEGSLHAFIINC